jgi:hypothetical protein
MVTRVELSRQRNGEKTIKITAKAIGDFHLGRGGVPGDTWFDNFDIPNALNSISGLLFQQIGTTLTFNNVNFPVLPPGNSFKDSRTNTLMEAMHNLCVKGGFRWRSRPDLQTPQIDVGNFGTLVNMRFVEDKGQSWHNTYETLNTFVVSDFSYYEDSEDAVSHLFIEGGTYPTGANSDPNTLLLGGSITNPGFTKLLVTFTGSTTGATYYVLRKDDCTIARWRRVNAGSIVPEATGSNPPSPPQITTAEQLLERVGENYLTINACTGKRHFGIRVPACITGRALVGDKVILQACLPCDETISDYLYVVAHDTEFGENGQAVHNIELSNVLDSLSDPLSVEFSNLFSRQVEVKRNKQFNLNGTTGPSGCVTINFPTVYTSPPAVTVQPVSGISFTVTPTTSDVTVCTTPVTPNLTITITVTPP